MIVLYSKDGLTEKTKIHKFSYLGEFMGESFVSTTIKSPIKIDFEIGDYLIYRDERFELNYIPPRLKTARKETNGDSFIYENIKFNSLADELTRLDFEDVVLGDNNLHYTSLTKFQFYASGVKDLADRIQANLDRVYTGTKQWTINVSPDFVSPDKNISVSDYTCWKALTLVHSEFGANFVIKGRTITIGTAGVAVPKVMSYGLGNGLYDIKQVANEDAKIITRLKCYGSTRNLPYRYYNNLKDIDGKPFMPEGMYMPNLSLPSFPYTTLKPHIDSENVDKYGIREGTVYFDGSNPDLPNIYPSIEGMTKEYLESVGINVSLPNGDNGKINEALGADNPTDDGILQEGVEIDGDFVIYLKDLGFDLSAKDENGEYIYASIDTMQISMKSGMCQSRTFDVYEDGITKDTSLGYTRFKVECKRFTDSSTSMAYPNKDWQIKAGDSFVILGIEMPEVYIKVASQRLQEAGEGYLKGVDDTKYTYVPTVSKNFMARNPELAYSIKEGDILTFTDDDFDIDASVIISTIKIADGEESEPKYDIVLNNEKVANTIEKLEQKINSLVGNGTGITLDQVKTLINSIGGSLFLSKKFDDVAQGLIKFVRGLDIGSFSTGALGGGGTFRMDGDNSYLEVDQLYVRKWAKFTELIIERLSHIGGSMIISPARMVCSKVEELDNAYRCYFEVGDGEFVQEFVVDDQARCQVFTGTTQKYYWRLVVGIGEDYIDLSKADMDKGSGIPEEGDHIVQLGHRTDETRQNAQILSSFGIDAPSYKQYQGINSYSLEGKEKTVISPEGNKFEGAMKIEAGSIGWENLVGLPEEFQSLVVGSVNLIRNSGFTGDYEYKRLQEDTTLSSPVEMYSEGLAYWIGDANINEDNQSASEKSATLTDQTLSQSVPTILGESYILSFKAKGSRVRVNVSGFVKEETLTSGYTKYVYKFQADDSKLLTITGRCTICEIQLERGTIPSEWNYSPLDNDKTLEQFEAIRYITDSVKNGNTTILGGLILSSMIQLGNYINGTMNEVTAGMSGVYQDGKDVAFWAGGDLQKAIFTSMNPTNDDASKYINFLVTHGGLLIANEAVIRGHITATSGSIGGFDIKDGVLESQAKGKDGKPIIMLDGINGEARISGDISSNHSGDRVSLSSKTRQLEIINNLKGLLGRWGFMDNGSVISVFYKASDVQTQESQISGSAITISTKNNNTTKGYISMSPYSISTDINYFNTKDMIDLLSIGDWYIDVDNDGVVKVKVKE